ncbi:MAG: pyridoxamine 5'-phosphate oxidase family protein [Gammaproteobacteria bacterium]|nr:pyridoxamine 5'-phosphate oxidase family protein [Gammaproteobacteria bacterium]MDH3407401.1 pyridoxamine 5'-phosphate oxidase family protein [Gammaproteobacteria bacterium]MDH3562351.1 pyridoxamine 5'-phosphate oxidase family protein [Gammaproteobacteria bacterium]MDH5487719.1 pyridoxamine 5'-phosphate oxidase family protein [Gammaproteobacteria bacterium]
MNPAYAQTLRELLRTQQVASLGTLRKGQPYVSMVPFAILPGGSGFVIHVSQLATHTKDMLLSPQVSLLIVAPPTPEIPAQALARVTIQGQAVPYTDATQGHAEAKAAYLSRFPLSAEMFSFSDFSLFAILPNSIRFIGGFAQATTLSPEVLANVLSED